MRYTRQILAAISLALLSSLSLSGASQSQPATTQPAAQLQLSTPAAPVAPPTSARESTHVEFPAVARGLKNALWPDFEGPAVTWFAVIVILVLTLRARPLGSVQNLDALVLALSCILLALRSETGLVLPDHGHTWQWWSYMLLAACAGYWVVRGIILVSTRSAPRPVFGLPAGAMLVLALAAIGLCVHHLSQSGVSAGSRDALVGGVFMAQTGKLPYGSAPGYEARSPLVYAVHAGAVKLRPPEVSLNGGRTVPITWDNQKLWSDGQWWTQEAPLATRLINAALFLLIFLGIYTIGARLHTPMAGITAAVIFCVFPGVVECLARPEITLPTMLLTWSIAFALLPGIGGLLCTFTLILAGLAWPWAWLALPAAWAFFLRRGWHAVGSTLGVVLGIAACIGGMIYLVEPALPRADGILRAAGRGNEYEVISRTPDKLAVVRVESPQAAASRSLLARGWGWLLDRDDVSLRGVSAGGTIEVAPGIPDSELYYRNVAVRDEARVSFQARYRADLAAAPEASRFWAGTRTVIESTLFPPAYPAPPRLSAWDLLRGDDSSAEKWQNIRRGAKAFAGIVAVFIAATLLFGRRGSFFHLIGAFVAIGGLAFIGSATGPVANWVWFMPPALAALCANCATVERRLTAPTSAENSPFPPPPRSIGPAPRVTIQ